MSMDIPGLVQTSCNLGIFKVGETGLAGSGSVRSSVASRKQLLHPENPAAHRKRSAARSASRVNTPRGNTAGSLTCAT